MFTTLTRVSFPIVIFALIAGGFVISFDADAQTRRNPRAPRAKATPTPPNATPQDQNLWNEASRINTKESYEFYLSEQPEGVFTSEARRRIEAIEEKKDRSKWNEAVAVNTMASYEKYLREHPGGRFMGEALERFRAFEKLEEEAQWKRADEASSASGYLQYLERYPYGANAGVAKLRLSGLGAVPPAIVWTNSLDMKFSWVPAGTFLMGSTDAQVEEALKECRRYSSECKRIWFEEEQPPRLVTIARGFWMGRYEVTQGQYKAVMGTNPSLFKTCGKDCPVERVSWNDAKEFISKLNARNDGFVYSLPSEAEWEYAARAGTTTAFAFGDSLRSTQANFNGNFPYGNAPTGPYLERTTKVGSYRPNAWGLYDMHGNVFEWVEDIWQDSYTGLPTDGSANTTRGDNRLRTVRGGSWLNYGDDSRSALRGRVDPSFRNYSDVDGFRVVARAR